MIDDEQMLVEARAIADGDSPKALFAALMIQILDVLDPFKPHLSSLGSRALEVGGRFWRSNQGSEKSLVEQRARIWSYMQEKNSSSATIADNEDRLLRAVLCTLYIYDGSESAEEVADWFALMINQLE